MGTTERGDGDRSHDRVRVLIAVKDLSGAKSRLSDAFSATDRTRLVLAMLSDTVAAAGRVSVVESVTVVTPDPAVVATATHIGARVFPEPADAAALLPNARLNHAFASAAHALGQQQRDQGRGVVSSRYDIIALQADLPALRTAELEQAYAVARRGTRSVVVDHLGSGTAALIVKGSAERLAPMFGPDSARRHTLSGAHRISGEWPGLRLDVDTLDDVHSAHRLGVGPATAAVLESLGWTENRPSTTA